MIYTGRSGSGSQPREGDGAPLAGGTPRRDDLLERVGSALEGGSIAPFELERLLERARRRAHGRPDVPGLLRALGLLIAFGGLALLYAVRFDGLPIAARELTPFAFPAALLAATLALHRARRPAWEVEAAGMLAYVALGLAFLAAAGPWDAGAAYGVVAGLASTVVVAAMHRAVRAVRLTGWGLSASLVAFTGFAADLAGVLGDGLPWLFLLQAALAVATGGLLLRRSRDAAEQSLRSAALLAYAAAVAGVPSWSALSPWQAELTVAVVATFLAAAALDLTGLAWVGALGALLWLAAAAALIGASSGLAGAVVLAGLGLLALASLLARLRRYSPRP